MRELETNNKNNKTLSLKNKIKSLSDEAEES